MNTNSYKNIKGCKMQKVQIITLEAMMVISVVLRSCMKWRRAAVMTLERSNSKKKKRRWWWLLCGGLWCFVRKKVRAGVEPPCPRTSVATDASNQSWALGWLLNSWVLKRTTREKNPNPNRYLFTNRQWSLWGFPLTCAHYYIWGGSNSEVEQFIY